MWVSRGSLLHWKDARSRLRTNSDHELNCVAQRSLFLLITVVCTRNVLLFLLREWQEAAATGRSSLSLCLCPGATGLRLGSETDWWCAACSRRWSKSVCSHALLHPDTTEIDSLALLHRRQIRVRVGLEKHWQLGADPQAGLPLRSGAIRRRQTGPRRRLVNPAWLLGQHTPMLICSN